MPVTELEEVMALEEAERLALEYVELAGELAAAVEWCVSHSGETLGDNPRQLAYARKVLAKARSKRVP
jgi:hypothetical protein